MTCGGSGVLTARSTIAGVNAPLVARPGVGMVAPHRSAGRLLWAEARPVVQVIFLVRFATAATLTLYGGGQLSARLATGAIAWLLLTLATYLVNGVGDVVEDRANGSSRPLASGRLDPRLALRAAQACTAVGLGLAAATSPGFLAAAVAMAVLGWAYSAGPAPLKTTTAGTMLAVLGGGLLTYTAGWEAARGPAFGELVVVAALMSAWMAVGGLCKDLGDTTGDRLTGRRTLAVRWGQDMACRALAAVALAVGAAAVVAAMALPLVAPAGLIMAGGAILVALLALRSTRWPERAEQRRAYRSYMLIQYAAHVAILLAWQG